MLRELMFMLITSLYAGIEIGPERGAESRLPASPQPHHSVCTCTPISINKDHTTLYSRHDCWLTNEMISGLALDLVKMSSSYSKHHTNT